ncbi:autotransporter domain-containing protein [Erythrobacter sp. HL-111]|uniref:autotransporter domain-containing protein n=1 Tax=Erythrobacter sp. HL-111 TaxID=1798193 RepID=UPI0006DB75D2|nr:autotransporter domain-containing protein [Erythrobacter sp. HL-111]KPP90432.1 MAG: autotransporter [Erythrobacteraceae bacterium HL-111]SDT14450.1 Autotransporter beta-domain-containing protein [Erythrobacter sp. HL-111]
MTNAFSTKFRAIGGASVLAISTGLVAAPGAAQVAPPQPVQSAPTPTAPAAPGNTQECALVTTVSPPEVICAPGTDPDGFDEDFNSISVTVEEGSQVQGEINLLVNVDATVDGSIVTSTDNGLLLGDAATVVNNGFIQVTSDSGDGIRTGNDSLVTNNGVISTNNDLNGINDGISVGGGSTVINNGLIQIDGSGDFGIYDNNGEGGQTVINSITGSIITTNDDGLGIALTDGATVENQGLIQTFGEEAIGIAVGAESEVLNEGFVFTTGENAIGVIAGDDSSVINTGSGNVFTFGDDAAAVSVGDDSFVQNNGIILTRGDAASAVEAGDGSIVINNPTGQIATTGDDSTVVTIDGDGTFTNSRGLIQATGADSKGVDISGDAIFDNSGRITSEQDRAVDIGGVGTVRNFEGAIIFSRGGDGLRVEGDGSTIFNAGLIDSDGDEAIEASGVNDLTVVNTATGIIRTRENGDKAIEAEENLRVENEGLIESAVSEAIEADAGGLVLINSGQIIARFDDAVDGDDDVTIMNSGLIQGGENDGLELNSGFIMNSGTIESVDSDPNGSLIIGGTVPELDAAIDFDAGTDGNEDGVVYNLEGGLIIGDIGINTSQGNQDSPDTNDGEQTVYNFGTITGRGENPANGDRFDAVLLGNGDDTFVKLNGGTENGVVDGQAGTDLFAFIITDDTDRSFDLSLLESQYLNFEDVRLGSQTFDFIENSLDAPVAGGVMTLTGTADQAVTVVNTAVLEGTVNATVTLIAGADEGIDPGLTIGEDGAIVTDGDGEAGFDASAADGAFLVNDGSITTTGESTAAVVFGDGSTLTNTGALLSEGTNGVAVAAGDDTTIDNAAGATITTTGDNGFGIVINGDGTVTNDGVISTDGPTAQAITIAGDGTVTNAGIIAARGGRAIDIAGLATVTNAEDGVIGSQDGDAIRFNSSGSTLVNAGEIVTGGDGALGLEAIDVADTTVENSGTIATEGDSTAGVYVGTDSVVNNSGQITSTGDRAIGVAAGDGSTVNNLAGAEISTEGSEAHGIVLVGDATIDNAGSITTTGDGAFGIIATSDFTLTNSGTISSDGARAIDLAGAGELTNLEGGSIVAADDDAIRFNAGGSTLTNRGSIAGEVGVRGSSGADTVANFGAIDGGSVGVALGDGADEFQQWSGASVTGDIDLGAGDDLFILEGAASSVTGDIGGGAGDDTAILAGTLDADNFTDFDTYQLGSDLGGTLDDLDIVGDRTLTGDVVHVGEVNVLLGRDSLTATGSITLEETGSLVIETPDDTADLFALSGQTVTVLDDGAGFTNNGATVNILDDDLLFDYEVVVGSLAVRVNPVNPLANSADANIGVFGGALTAGINAGTIDLATLDRINRLPDSAAMTGAAADALPSLSEGMGREIFESANLASAALDRHLMGEGSGVWGQIAVRGAEQDSLSLSADGYESDQLVFTVGADFELFEDVRFGLLASYADIDTQDLRNDSVPTERNEAESIKLGVYMSAGFFDRGFINGEVAYLTGDIESRRDGFFGATNSNYDFDGFSSRVTAGFDLIPDENVSVTPTIGINAARINFDDVAETGGFGFTVERGDAVFAELRGGLNLGAQVSEGVNGFVSGTVIRDLIDDPRSFRLSSSQLGSFLVNLPMRERNRFELAAGASITVSEGFAVDLGYLGDFNEGYQGHSARANVRFAF